MAGLLFEDAREVEGGVESELQGNLFDGQVGAGEQVFGAADAELQMVLPGRQLGMRLERAPGMAGSALNGGVSP